MLGQVIKHVSVGHHTYPVSASCGQFGAINCPFLSMFGSFDSIFLFFEWEYIVLVWVLSMYLWMYILIGCCIWCSSLNEFPFGKRKLISYYRVGINYYEDQNTIIALYTFRDFEYQDPYVTRFFLNLFSLDSNI